MEYEEVQNNEVEALKAIYGPDFEELESPKVWNQRAPPKFTIFIRPSSDFSNAPPIELKVMFQLTPTYPNTKPLVEIVHKASLSGRQVEILKQIITSTIQEMLKTEMVFEIMVNLQQQIDDWARSVSQAAPSLELDRLRRLEIAEARQSQVQEEIDQARRLEAEKNEQKYDKLILKEIERSQHSNDLLPLPDDEPYLLPASAPNQVTTFERTILIEPPFTQTPVKFRQVCCSLKVLGPKICDTFIAKIVQPPHKPLNEDLTVCLMEIRVDETFWKSSDGVRELHNLNSELENIRQVKLPGVVPLSDFSIERIDEDWRILLVSPLMRLTPLSEIINSTGPLSLKQTQTWVLQLLECLGSLHKKGIRHKLVSAYNVMIQNDLQTGETKVLLRNVQYLYHLEQLNDSHAFNKQRKRRWSEGSFRREQLINDSFVSLPPEHKRKNNSTPSPKWDMWQLGSLMTLMVAGKHNLAKYKFDAESFLRSKPRNIPHVFIKFALRLLQNDPAKRPGALELLTDEFFRTDFDLGFEDESESAITSLETSTEDSIDSVVSVPPLPRSSSAVFLRHELNRRLPGNNALHLLELQQQQDVNPLGSYGRRRLSSNEESMMYSRYKHDFDEGIVLGKGGFGQVVKARNKLDGRVYAVKKIRATPSTLSHILQEVVLLSRLNHQYVVRYYTVWLEDEADGTPQLYTTDTHAELSSAIEFDSVELSSTVSQQQKVTDTIPSSSMSQFSNPHSLDYPSVSQDFMSDSGFVEFGFSDSENAVLYDADSEGKQTAKLSDEEKVLEEDEEEVVAVTKKRKEKRLSNEHLKQLTHKTLYIQMEYCENHTLGDLVKQGLYKNPKEYWRFLKQILEALSYIHGEGVIHRDLKPKNIFIDQAKNIKIGDFGLARSMAQPIQSRQPSMDILSPTFNQQQQQQPPTTVNANLSDFEEFTTDVGTSLYAAVEITGPNAHSKRGYNEKVDIFSLGIIFFEMVYKMNTEMERIVDIKRARTPQIELPAELVNNKDKQVEVALIKCMLDHDPTRRPSAHGLLKSGRIPIEESDMTVVEALHNMRDERVVNQVVNALFSRPLLSAQQVLYDRVNVSNVPPNRRTKPKVVDANGCLSMSEVLYKLKLVFRSHGAVDNTLFRSRVFPRSPLYKMPTVFELMDQQGTVLQLPYDLTLPHARRLAEVVPNYQKTFAVDTVFRSRLQHIGQHPAKHIEVDFDIVCTKDDEDSMVFDEAETIGVMYDSANKVLNLENVNDLIVVVGHHDIMSATLSHCGLEPPQFHAALVLLSTDRRTSNLHRSNVSTASMDMLSQFAFREAIKKSESRMARLMPLSQRVRHAINHVTRVAESFKTLCATNKDPQILFSPLVHSMTPDFYMHGVMFQLVDVKQMQGNARQYLAGSVLAVGGRYDSLVQSFRNSMLDSHTPLVKAVGFGMSADKLEAMAAKQQVVVPRCQVLISSLSDQCLKQQGLDTARVLWSVGVSADILWSAQNNEDVLLAAQQSGIPLIVMIRQGTSNLNNTTFKPLRVKRVSNVVNPGEVVDLSLHELVPFIQTELDTDESLMSDIEEITPKESSGTQLNELSKVIVLNETGKLKGGRKNKWLLEEKSVSACSQFLTELKNAPIVSLDLRDDVILAIMSVHPTSVEDWKRRVVGLSPNQKAYILQVQAKLANEASRVQRMILFSLKSENVFVYTY